MKIITFFQRMQFDVYQKAFKKAAKDQIKEKHLLSVCFWLALVSCIWITQAGATLTLLMRKRTLFVVGLVVGVIVLKVGKVCSRRGCRKLWRWAKIIAWVAIVVCVAAILIRGKYPFILRAALWLFVILSVVIVKLGIKLGEAITAADKVAYAAAYKAIWSDEEE